MDKDWTAHSDCRVYCVLYCVPWCCVSRGIQSIRSIRSVAEHSPLVALDCRAFYRSNDTTSVDIIIPTKWKAQNAPEFSPPATIAVCAGHVNWIEAIMRKRKNTELADEEWNATECLGNSLSWKIHFVSFAVRRNVMRSSEMRNGHWRRRSDKNHLHMLVSSSLRTPFRPQFTETIQCSCIYCVCSPFVAACRLSGCQYSELPMLLFAKQKTANIERHTVFMHSIGCMRPHSVVYE